MSMFPTRREAPSFTSPEILAAVNNLEPTLAAYKRTVDALCADIVALERLLQERQVLINIFMCTGFGPRRDEPGDEHYYYFLRWEAEKSGKFRLFYTVEHEFDDEEPPREKRPLAEAPLHLRVKLSAELPNFLQTAARELKQWQTAYTALANRDAFDF